jgi:dTMP kinase
MNSDGLFITFEGGEGCGKSTQMKILGRRLESADIPFRMLREPGGTRVGEEIRAVLLDTAHAGLDARAELLLYEAARAQLVAEVIEPALEAGEIVVCDRFFDSTTAYQGHGRGLPLDEVASLNLSATGGLVPDVTILLDIDPRIGLERATGEGADRLESEDLSFHHAVRDGFLAIAREEPARVRVIDAEGTVDEVADRVMAALRGVVQLASLFRTGTA